MLLSSTRSAGKAIDLLRMDALVGTWAEGGQIGRKRGEQRRHERIRGERERTVVKQTITPWPAVKQ